MSLTNYNNMPLPTYADAYDEGYKRAYEAIANGDDTSLMVMPGWASGNLHVPFQNGWNKALEEVGLDGT